MPVGSELARTRSRVAVASRLGSPEDIAVARRDHAAAKIADCVKRALSTAPPLTAEQRDRIARLLTPAGGGAS